MTKSQPDVATMLCAVRFRTEPATIGSENSRDTQSQGTSRQVERAAFEFPADFVIRQ
jgi:hypothetical protein